MGRNAVVGKVCEAHRTGGVCRVSWSHLRGSKARVVGCRLLSVMAGAIPESLGQLGGLQTMDLSGNQLSGECGRTLGNLKGSDQE